jgi:hypothetical protein
MLVQQACRAAVDTPATEEGASRATSRWCWSRDCRRGAMSECCCPYYCCRSHQSHCSCLSPSPSPSPFPLPFPLPPLLGVGAGGGGAIRGTMIPVVVGVEVAVAVADAILLRA